MLTTAEEVARLQTELAEMQPQLEQAQVETEQTMDQIEKDTSESTLSPKYYMSMRLSGITVLDP